MTTPTHDIHANEHASSSAAHTSPTHPQGMPISDIEHAQVEDDPRTWSDARKIVILIIISGASMIAGLSANIQNPANAQIEQDLHATALQISASLSLLFLVQGNVPLLWSAVSEIKGRKFVYLLSLALFTMSSAIVASSKSTNLFIGMRGVQGVGSSAVISIGAATLADIYEPHERGRMMGIYYSAPLLGPSLGPLLGGELTQAFGWRAISWFLTILGGVVFLAFLFLFKDTFRKERSLVYQTVLKRQVAARQLVQEKATKTAEDDTCGARAPQCSEESQSVKCPVPTIHNIKLSIADVNPFPLYIRILSRKNNVMILIPSALLFAFGMSIAYTCARTLSLHYDYDAMKTGLVLLAFGIGSILGSVLGGRYSDRSLSRLSAANGGVSYPEMRLESTKPAMWGFPPAVLGYAWASQLHTHVSAICVALFFSGFFSIWIYASTLAYIVDANVGRSSSAVAANSSWRCLAAFVAIVVAVPLQDAIGDGGLYTLWAGLVLLAELMILLVLYKGKRWREASVEREEKRSGS